MNGACRSDRINLGTVGGRGGPVRRQDRARDGQAASARLGVASTRPSPAPRGAAWTLERIGSSGGRGVLIVRGIGRQKGEVRTGVDERDEEEEEQRASTYGADPRPRGRHIGAKRRQRSPGPVGDEID